MSPVTKKHNKLVRALFAPFRFIIKKCNKTSYVKLEYRYITGHKLNLDNPTRYTEKLQYLRLYTYANNKLVSKLASRDGLREYALEKGFANNLVKTYGIFDNFNDINFNLLPKQFVIKCTHGCGMNEIVYDKSKPNGTPRKLMDATKIKALGWQPKISLEEGIRHAYEWYLAQ